MVYGLALDCELPLPDVQPCDAQGGVKVRFGVITSRPSAKTSYGTNYHAEPGSISLFYQNVGAFQVKEGREIIIDRLPSVDDSLLRLFLLGPVLPFILHQRGHLVLHASAVLIGDSAVAFVGNPGAGKSTSAAAFYAAGFPVLTDDVLPIWWENDRPVVYPGWQRAGLWPDAIRALGADPELFPRLHPAEDKRLFSTPGLDSTARPLDKLYVLEYGTEVSLQTLRSSEALMELLRHSFYVRLLGPTGATAHNFAQCGRLAQSVGVSRLTRLAELSGLNQIVSAVCQDLALESRSIVSGS